MSWENKLIFTATLENPNHEYVFKDKFIEVSSGSNGFNLMGLSRVQTQLTEKGDLIIRSYIGDQFIGKDFVFNFQDNQKVNFYQKYLNGEPHYYFSFELTTITG